jgi:hypothetical protein
MAYLEITQISVQDRQEDYYALLLWAKYMEARGHYEQAHADYVQNKGADVLDTLFLRLRSTEAAQAQFLAQLRRESLRIVTGTKSSDFELRTPTSPTSSNHSSGTETRSAQPEVFLRLSLLTISTMPH